MNIEVCFFLLFLTILLVGWGLATQLEEVIKNQNKIIQRMIEYKWMKGDVKLDNGENSQKGTRIYKK